MGFSFLLENFIQLYLYNKQIWSCLVYEYNYSGIEVYVFVVLVKENVFFYDNIMGFIQGLGV